MGIDIYMKWDGFTEEDKKAQYEGWLATKNGHTGYLREAYHGGPYVTKLLVKEAFEFQWTPEMNQDEDEELGYVRIPADLLIDRLPEAIKLAIERARFVYNEDLDQYIDEVKSFVDFVGLTVKLERDGKNPRIYASY